MCPLLCRAIFFAVTWIDRISTLSVYSRSNDIPRSAFLATTMDAAAKKEKHPIHRKSSSGRTEKMKATAVATTPPASSARQGGGGGLSWSQSVEMSQHKSQEVRYDCRRR